MMEETLDLRFFKVGKEEKDTITYRTIKSELSIDLTFFQGETIEEDLQRRDFTINAIAFSLLDATFHWVEGALEDIEKKVIRTVSDRLHRSGPPKNAQGHSLPLYPRWFRSG